MIARPGAGSTVAYLHPVLAVRGLDLRAAGTSPATEHIARDLGIKVEPFRGAMARARLDIAIDGADQVARSGQHVRGSGATRGAAVRHGGHRGAWSVPARAGPTSWWLAETTSSASPPHSRRRSARPPRGPPLRATMPSAKPEWPPASTSAARRSRPPCCATARWRRTVRVQRAGGSWPAHLLPRFDTRSQHVFEVHAP